MPTTELTTFHNALGAIAAGGLAGQLQAQQDVQAQQQQQQEFQLRQQQLAFEQQQAQQRELEGRRAHAATYATALVGHLTNPDTYSYLARNGMLPTWQNELNAALRFSGGASQDWTPNFSFPSPASGGPGSLSSPIPPPAPGAVAPGAAPGVSSSPGVGTSAPALTMPPLVPNVGMARQQRQAQPLLARPDLAALSASLLPGERTAPALPAPVLPAPVTAPATTPAATPTTGTPPAFDPRAALRTLLQQGAPVLTREAFETDKQFNQRQAEARREYASRVRSLQGFVTELDRAARPAPGAGRPTPEMQAYQRFVSTQLGRLATLDPASQQPILAEGRRLAAAAGVKTDVWDQPFSKAPRPATPQTGAADLSTLRSFLAAVRSKDWASQSPETRAFWIQEGQGAARRLGRPLPADVTTRLQQVTGADPSLAPTRAEYRSLIGLVTNGKRWSGLTDDQRLTWSNRLAEDARRLGVALPASALRAIQQAAPLAAGRTKTDQDRTALNLNTRTLTEKNSVTGGYRNHDDLRWPAYLAIKRALPDPSKMPPPAAYHLDPKQRPPDTQPPAAPARKPAARPRAAAPAATPAPAAGALSLQQRRQNYYSTLVRHGVSPHDINTLMDRRFGPAPGTP